jgi:hypothetical protein
MNGHQQIGPVGRVRASNLPHVASTAPVLKVARSRRKRGRQNSVKGRRSQTATLPGPFRSLSLGQWLPLGLDLECRASRCPTYPRTISSVAAVEVDFAIHTPMAAVARRILDRPKSVSLPSAPRCSLASPFRRGGLCPKWADSVEKGVGCDAEISVIQSV